MKDWIWLHDIVLFARLGVTAEERKVGTRVHLDVGLQADLEAPGRSDVLRDTINYEAVYRAVEQVVVGSDRRLMEALAHDVVEHLFDAFPVNAIRIRIRKPNVPFSGTLASAEVEMTRTR